MFDLHSMIIDYSSCLLRFSASVRDKVYSPHFRSLCWKEVPPVQPWREIISVLVVLRYYYVVLRLSEESSSQCVRCGAIIVFVLPFKSRLSDMLELYFKSQFS